MSFCLFLVNSSEIIHDVLPLRYVLWPPNTTSAVAKTLFRLKGIVLKRSMEHPMFCSSNLPPREGDRDTGKFVRSVPLKSCPEFVHMKWKFPGARFENGLVLTLYVMQHKQPWVCWVFTY